MFGPSVQVSRTISHRRRHCLPRPGIIHVSMVASPDTTPCQFCRSTKRNITLYGPGSGAQRAKLDSRPHQEPEGVPRAALCNLPHERRRVRRRRHHLGSAQHSHRYSLHSDGCCSHSDGNSSQRDMILLTLSRMLIAVRRILLAVRRTDV